MKFNNIKITNKLLIGFGMMLVLIIIVGVVSIAQFSTITAVITRNQVKIAKKDIIKEREINHLDWALAVTNGLANGKAEDIDVETDGHKCKFGKWYYSDEREALEKDIPSLKKILINVEAPHLELHKDVIALKDALRFGGVEGRNKANIIYRDKIANDLKEVRANLNEINKIIENNVAKSEETVFEGISLAKTIIIVISILSLIVGTVIGMLISKSINNPIKKCLGLAAKLAEGDLTARVDLDQSDELGRLSKALNDAANGLETLISSVMLGSQNLAQVVEQIANGNQNLSQRTSEQASSLEEIASTIEEATATIKQNAENAGRAQELTDAGSVKSVEGNKVALDAVNSIIDMNDSSKKIADIIAVINEIAFQTNLLALNAAVEAARAGEQGRGFAVVAGEVRNLAQRSGNAAKEIEALIKDTVNKVKRSTELVNRTGEALNEIAEAAKTTAQIISEIAGASQEQKQGISQINNAITELDNTTQQNASLVEETASASEEMANQAQELLEMVLKFKIREN